MHDVKEKMMKLSGLRDLTHFSVNHTKTCSKIMDHEVIKRDVTHV